MSLKFSIEYFCISCSLLQRFMIASTAGFGSAKSSTLTQLRGMTEASLSPLPLAITIPGLSRILMFFVITTSFMFLVNPGVDPTPQAFALFKLLITLLFPTFGYPTTPTTMEVVDRQLCSNYSTVSTRRQHLHTVLCLRVISDVS